MRQKIIHCIVGFILGIMPMMGANVTDNPEHLVFGKKWMEGACQAQLIQCLHVEVTNTGEEDYQGWWVVIDKKTGEMLDKDVTMGIGTTGLVTVAAGETKVETIAFCFPKPGSYELYIAATIDFVNPIVNLFDYTIDIGENVAPKIKGSIQVDMLEKTDNGNVLYGDFAHFRITGTATITNEDENTVFGDGGGIEVIMPWFGETVWEYPTSCKLGQSIKSGETITKDFVCEIPAVPEEGKEYDIKIMIAGNIITRIPFTVKQCTNTYWTAEGQVRPLPLGEDQVLRVPFEALAVDMRGQYEMNTVFSIDVSEANPNCLYYLGYLDNVPQGFSSTANLIRDYEAKNLFINTDCDYYCPMPFKAKTALLEYTPVSEANGPAQPYMSEIMSGTLVLPFDATTAWLNDVNGAPGVDAGFNEDHLRVSRFVEDVGTYMFFEPVTGNHLNAYEPYLLSVIPSSVSFYAEDVTIPSTRPAIAEGKNFDFVGSTVAVALSTNMFRWSCDHNYFYQSDTDTGVFFHPFSALMYLKKELSAIEPDGEFTDKFIGAHLTVANRDDEDGDAASEIHNIRKVSCNEPEAIYSLSGQHLKATPTRGICIIDGKKVIIK